jgi:hypothetical protein
MELATGRGELGTQARGPWTRGKRALLVQVRLAWSIAYRRRSRFIEHGKVQGGDGGRWEFHQSHHELDP